jgi:predicted nucleic acid-binding protein
VIVLDTAVLLYAIGDDHTLREPALRVLAAVADREIAATTTVEVIQEFAHVRARRRSRAEAVARADSYRRLLAPLVSVDEPALEQGLALFAAHERLGAFDAVLAAVALALPGGGLVTSDRAFGDIPGLACHDLASPSFLGDLGLSA